MPCPFFFQLHIMSATVGQLKRWVGNDYQRVIALEIAMNARGVYNFLKKNNMLGPNWTPGVEGTQTNRLKMGTILNAAAVKSGRPLDYAKMLAAATPDVDLSKDYAAQAEITKLLLNNPNPAQI